MGLGLLIAGALALSDIANVNTDHVKPLLDTIEVGSFQAGSMATNLSILLIVIREFIMIVIGLGLFGACCQNKCMLVVVESEIKAKLVTALNNNYKDNPITNSNSVSNAWNYMFMTCYVYNI
uniref:Uncharacterized protein LOC111124100 n=1 Tax=Crassostrea virginica TaxID=6565 RepID=A0A8B8D3G0_CRAVI|nr:uncharacterized protein LOC111124100 [Crassostrea virginica]